MSGGDPIDLGLGILDHQLVDADGRRCGKVDDLELEADEAGLRVAAIVVGGSGRSRRGRIGAFVAGLARGGRAVVVPWQEVQSVDSAVRLRHTAAELGLGRGDDRVRPWIARLPGSGL
jgi:sporulation protein YlmC with PRC-barrel domain